MKITFTVNNVYSTTRPAVGTVQGVDLSVSVPEMEVELYDPTGKHGSQQLHFRTPEEQAYAKAVFVNGSTVDVIYPDAPVVEAAPEAEPEPVLEPIVEQAQPEAVAEPQPV